MRARLAIAIVLLAASTFASSLAAGVRADWPALRRPLHLPTVAIGAKCPVSRFDPRLRQGRMKNGRGLFIGRGPVYPGLGQSSGLLWATRPTQGPWFGEKVFWYVAPSYQGPALIRGRRLDGPESVRFDSGRRLAAELHIARGQTVTWEGQPAGSRGVPSGVRIESPGCYAFQIDGMTFSRIVIFVGDVAH